MAAEANQLDYEALLEDLVDSRHLQLLVLDAVANWNLGMKLQGATKREGSDHAFLKMFTRVLCFTKGMIVASASIHGRLVLCSNHGFTLEEESSIREILRLVQSGDKDELREFLLELHKMNLLRLVKEESKNKNNVEAAGFLQRFVRGKWRKWKQDKWRLRRKGRLMSRLRWKTKVVELEELSEAERTTKQLAKWQRTKMTMRDLKYIASALNLQGKYIATNVRAAARQMIRYADVRIGRLKFVNALPKTKLISSNTDTEFVTKLMESVGSGRKKGRPPRRFPTWDGSRSAYVHAEMQLCFYYTSRCIMLKKVIDTRLRIFVSKAACGTCLWLLREYANAFSVDLDLPRGSGVVYGAYAFAPPYQSKAFLRRFFSSLFVRQLEIQKKFVPSWLRCMAEEVF